MIYQLELDDYKQEVADFYDRRSQTYDDNESLVQICRRLLEYAQVEVGQTVLDVGTGTGHLAIALAQIVGDKGRVIGIDISPKMLEQARIKVNELRLKNIELQLADAETLDYSINTFDRILCANTFPWLEEKEATLRLWHQFLKPGGQISIHTPADTAYIGAVVLRQVFAKHGILLEASNRLGSIDQCQNLFANAGFAAIQIETEQRGSYTNLNKAKATWEGIVVNPSATSLRVTGHSLSQLSSTRLSQIKTEFEAELVALQTKQGLWDDLTTLYIMARKPKDQSLVESSSTM
jgi:ubiquinone/menaquinone biosynthesis C-methylase UbiE